MNPYARAREDHKAELAEDYLELIHRLGGAARTGDLVEALGVAQPTVTQTLDRLQRDGFVQVRPRRGVELTNKGRSIAEESRKRHELTVGFLVALGVPKHIAELDAEGIEHHLSETTMRAMRQFVEEKSQ